MIRKQLRAAGGVKGKKFGFRGADSGILGASAGFFGGCKKGGTHQPYSLKFKLICVNEFINLSSEQSVFDNKSEVVRTLFKAYPKWV